MWMMVLFDIPVDTKKSRKEAADFRHYLLDQGFQMSQFSVYLKHLSGKEQANALTKKIEKVVPAYGNIKILYFTDKQYENIVSFHGRVRQSSSKNPAQLALF